MRQKKSAKTSSKYTAKARPRTKVALKESREAMKKRKGCNCGGGRREK